MSAGAAGARARALPACALAAALAAAGCDAGGNPGRPWVVVHRGRSAVASFDTSRVVTRGPATEVWLRFDYTEAEEMPGEPGTTFDRVEVHTRLECATRRVKDLRMQTRSGDGPPLMSDENPTTFETFGEHPFGKYVLPAVCERLPRLRAGRS